VLVEEEAPTGDIPSVATEVATEELIEVATETVSNKATSDVLGGNVLGGDVGIKTLATCSDGTCCANPKALAAKIKFTERRSLRHAARSKRTVTPLRIKHCTLMLHAFFCVVASRR
jgi:transposase